MKLDDKDIRKFIIERLQSYKDCFVYEEVTVPSGKARADIVAINGHISAYEIKSDFDSLSRLRSQIKEYDLNFERNYVVTGEKFSKDIINIVPDYWGIILVSGESIEKIKISFLRQAKLNPNLSFSNFLSLLTSDQVKELAKNIPFFTKNHTKTDIQKMFKQDLVFQMELKLSKSKKQEIKKIVRDTLKGKESIQ